MTRIALAILISLSVLTSWNVVAQEANAENSDAVAGGVTPPTALVSYDNPGFVEIVFKAGKVNLFIWLLIFGTSFATGAFIVDGALLTRREKILPANLVIGVRQALDSGDLDGAIDMCEMNPCQLSNILMAGFSNIHEGYETVQESIGAATDIESEKIIQRIGYLNLCGQIAPMLGLLGTVTGMVKAFAELSQAGADRDRQLATAISTALWTTVSGLLIAVPALISYTLYKNIATQHILESEATVLDIIKNLRGAEVEDDFEDAEDWA